MKYEFGIQKDDIVGIYSENTILYPSLVLSVWHIGGVCALFNPMYTTSTFKINLNHQYSYIYNMYLFCYHCYHYKPSILF